MAGRHFEFIQSSFFLELSLLTSSAGIPAPFIFIIIGCYYYTAEAMVTKAVIAVFNLCLVSNCDMFSVIVI
jgi:hypothetical protein